MALQVPDEALKEYEGKFEDPPYVGGKGYTPHFKPKAAYAAMITRMDRDIGKMMTLVKELGLEEKTIFVFTSDNGPLSGTHQGLAGTDARFFNSSAGLRDGKGTLYEGGFRVPGIVRWKGKIAPAQTSDRVTGFEDWMPTLMELSNSSNLIPKDADGISFAPTLLGVKQPDRPFLYREFPGYGGQIAVIMNRWKGIKQKMNQGKNQLELYDLSTDPKETTDVAAKNPEIVAKIQEIMKGQHIPSKEFPLPSVDFDPKKNPMNKKKS